MSVADHVAGQLTGFQRRTVDHAFRRLFEAKTSTRRFLVADEVGLGKTLVARGVIARALDRAARKRRGLHVVYLCSNAAIAGANIAKLHVGDDVVASRLERLTLLALDQSKSSTGRAGALRFTALTPGTSFAARSGLGHQRERLVIYSLLADLEGHSRALVKLTRGDVTDIEKWQGKCHKERGLDKKVQARFERAYRSRKNKRLRATVAAGLDRYRWKRQGQHVGPEDRLLQREAMGGLRVLLSQVVLDRLRPDLIILDEFQRFRHLLRDEEGDGARQRPARELATRLFEARGGRAHTLLLSATPYRMYSTEAERIDDDHYADFVLTTRFLLGDDDDAVARLERKLRVHREAMQAALSGEDIERPQQTRKTVERVLRRVMSRTERVRATVEADGMIEPTRHALTVDAASIRHFAATDRLFREVGAHGAVDYWKSAPYLPHFMRRYRFDRRLTEQLQDAPGSLDDAIGGLGEDLLTAPHIRRRRRLRPPSPRLRHLVEAELEDSERRAQALWVPPSLPYWSAGGPFAAGAGFTKRLVFSAWNLVPGALSAVLSYEAELRMTRGLRRSYDAIVKSHSRPLRVPVVSTARAESLAAVALLYPCWWLARKADPLRFGSDRAALRDRIQARLDDLSDREGPVDERWLWMGGAWLDGAKRATRVLQEWEGPSERFAVFKDRMARELHRPPGKPPKGLAQRLVELTLGSPAILATRTFLRLGAKKSEAQLHGAAVARAFWALFNRPAASRVVATAYRKRGRTPPPFHRSLLRYSADGNLQAVLDEQAYLVEEQLRWKNSNRRDRLAEVERVLSAQVQPVRAEVRARLLDRDPASGHRVASDQAIRCDYALRYGALPGQEDRAAQSERAVRQAFNSPFRPFVLVSTSRGQEGLDFHTWCHAVTHWNLPGNPVDLEQREGRVHRYKGHAVRRNLANDFGDEALRSASDGANPWEFVFQEGQDAARDAGRSELAPCWIWPGEHKVQRQVPGLALSREVEQLKRLERQLALYRLVFGQPRQQELLEMIRHCEGASEDLSEDDLRGWGLDLRPPGSRRRS